MVVVATALIHKFDLDLLPDSIDVPVAPIFERIGGRLSTTFFDRPVVLATARMCVNFIGRTIHDVNAPAVGSPARNSRCVVLIRVRDAAIVLFLEFVFDCVGSRIASQPELLDELISFFVVAQPLESLTLFIRDDPAHILVEPLLVRLAQLALECLLVFFLLLVSERSLQRILIRLSISACGFDFRG